MSSNPPKAGPLKVGLAGLGTVGAGVIKLLDANAALIARRAGRPILVTAVCARDRTRERGVDLARFQWVDDATTLAGRDDVDVVVELVGGADGPALTLARATLAANKPFVTANKAMIAHHGLLLAELAEASGTPLKFEAAVAGGIPVIKGLREGAAANELSLVTGILNGTCNYILTRMEKEGLEFADVLADAQRLGYAEADPSFDIDGIDAAHKLSILAAIAFGSRPDFHAVETCGIRDIRLADIRQAAALGFKVRLVGLAQVLDGRLVQRVHPSLVPLSHPLAAVEGPLNAVVAEGNFVGRLLFTGRGAGEGPTASAVAADLIDIARGENGPAFAMPADALHSLPPAGAEARHGRAYIRLTVEDRPGVLADITAALRDAGVSIESLIQPASSTDGIALVVMLTHETGEEAIRNALSAMAALPAAIGTPLFMPILPQDG
ncbi:homoserine dehydrogenase [Sandaracinobacter sp. RS1-74]|uniref:homoserine dehydrogenase n=1 Tax=Sandaracinobacteroides sayramensis TaxID=2913411 RepID=UPI001EDB2BE7|nr:homoserine dehydrogenase [Sandaracinobacteroides sayramensis]MCG2841972.1 homoserine dehydrogenase [Sandaracinobacteroides sayramensis]